MSRFSIDVQLFQNLDVVAPSPLHCFRLSWSTTPIITQSCHAGRNRVVLIWGFGIKVPPRVEPEVWPSPNVIVSDWAKFNDSFIAMCLSRLRLWNWHGTSSDWRLILVNRLLRRNYNKRNYSSISTPCLALEQTRNDTYVLSSVHIDKEGLQSPLKKEGSIMINVGRNIAIWVQDSIDPSWSQTEWQVGPLVNSTLFSRLAAMK